MTNAELLAKIKIEVEKRLKNTRDYMNGVGMKYKGPKYHASRGRESAYDAILSFLSTLESEKPMNQEGLNEEISKSIENLEGCTTKINDNPEYHLISDEDIRKFARHFAEWGAEHLADARKMSQNDLEEAAKEYAKTSFTRPYSDTPEEVVTIIEPDKCAGFIAGAKWMADHAPLPEDTVLFNKGVAEGKRLMMEEAVEGEYGYFSNATKTILPSGKLNLKEGDKVHIIIVKENEK